MRRRRKLLSQVVIEACEIIPIGCLRCRLAEGDGALLYPYPKVKGTLYCPRCSPAWLKSFLDFATENLKREINGECQSEGG